MHEKEISSLFKQGKCYKTPFFKFYWTVNQSGNMQLCPIVRKKTLNKAVSRNYLKRIIRACAREQMNSSTGISIVVLANHSILKLETEAFYQEASKSWEKFLKKIKVTESS